MYDTKIYLIRLNNVADIGVAMSIEGGSGCFVVGRDVYVRPSEGYMAHVAGELTAKGIGFVYVTAFESNLLSPPTIIGSKVELTEQQVRDWDTHRAAMASLVMSGCRR